MAMRLGALRDALLNPGDEVRGNKAAEDVAGHENHFTAIKVDLAAVRGDLTLVKWMLASVLGIVLTVALKLFVHP